MTMNQTYRPIILTAVILAVIALAIVAILFVFDVVPRDELQDSLVKTLTTIGIVLLASLVVWGLLQITKRD